MYVHMYLYVLYIHVYSSRYSMTGNDDNCGELELKDINVKN